MTDFLVEVHTEELPALSLQKLSLNFLETLQSELKKSALSFNSACAFATPRRLAVLIKELSPKQNEGLIEKKGPVLSAAFDISGEPTPACLGFARSCGVAVSDLIELKNEQGTWIGIRQSIIGKTVEELLPEMVEVALKKLPINKRMRWGSSSTEFSRPIHSVILLYGEAIIPAKILGISTDRKTQGHRFHSNDWVSISDASCYADELKKHFVIADFNTRKNKIVEQIKKIASPHTAIIDDQLLEEVAGLVEWPVALKGQFDANFLKAPHEALIASMKNHQRYFPVIDEKSKLLSFFIMISNIESKAPDQVIKGNERVLSARLSDAAFFFETDKKKTLKEHALTLPDAHQKKQRDIAEFVEKTAQDFAISSLDVKTLCHISHLIKADLSTQTVGEFPELQGIIGKYLALHENMSQKEALAIEEHYFPRFSGDTLPTDLYGAIFAIADRITLIADLFSLHKIPTGDKDPFGLRRAALGILRILIEKNMSIDLKKLLAATSFGDPKTKEAALDFIVGRLKPFYQEKGISAEVIASVMALNITNPYDLDRRIHAVNAFKQSPDSAVLSAANKRVSQILAKNEIVLSAKSVDSTLFEHLSEKTLFEKIEVLKSEVSSSDYTNSLLALSTLREPIDDFFNEVLVMTEDQPRRENRLLLLRQLRNLFLSVADVALLQ